ncbi:MAG: formate C-acetyltransferase/glycerol dehydratase family glycyl radical enzyme, partial [Defluviitaleaceae bacterium]|nr:formate C-acetyltransferase/glycerol dehydratase family glycyl radical enzyme [Defluviitaleaceae bacterium]
ELIVGNRTPGIRGGVVFPEAGVSWVERELDTLPTRPQDKFLVKKEDADKLRGEIFHNWKGKTLEDAIQVEAGELINEIRFVAKINQTDHAQGHICPDTKTWLSLGPAGLLKLVKKKLLAANGSAKIFFESLVIVLEASRIFMRRYGSLAAQMAEDGSGLYCGDLVRVSKICGKLADSPPESFHEALQSLWFLFTLLHMESNASSFSPGRMDCYLYPYYINDIEKGLINDNDALELIESLWLKFNQIVYMRSADSAKYFAGFPIGFNVAIGGQTLEGGDASNELSRLFLKAQEHVGLPQPNLSARIFSGTPDDLLENCSALIGRGGGMPQIFNDEAIIPALINRGIDRDDAVNYAAVGCVELSTHGNFLGWSDAAMFNLVKVLELTLNGGRCMLSGEKIGPGAGTLSDYETYESLEKAYASQISFYTEKMMKACEIVDRIHQRVLPSPFLSSVVGGCIDRSMDVTAGGAHYNFLGVTAIQPANIADSLAAIKKFVYDEKILSKSDLLEALRDDFKNREGLRQKLLNEAPKYGNDVEWVDEIGHKWIRYFSDEVGKFRNIRSGPCHIGMYTVSAHLPMGRGTGASADGRRARDPLADGGMSAMSGRDRSGPTALLRSVSRIDSKLGSNGSLLNMKFHPAVFSDGGHKKFASMLRTITDLKITHAQFNVVNGDDLLAAQAEPDKYRSLTVRVAGYSAYFTELAKDLQDEIIARTVYTDL